MTIAICTVVVAAALSLGGSTATSRAFTERLLTFGSLSSDTSANQRVATPAALLPGAVSAPLGHGLGTAGEATRLRPDSPLRAPDNGYLSLLYQLGPAGLLLILTGAATPLAAITKRVVGQGARDPESVLLFAVGVFMVLLLFGGDLFYGVTGVMLWYLLGRALAVSTRSRRAHRRPPEALTGAGPDRSSPPTMVAAQ